MAIHLVAAAVAKFHLFSRSRGFTRLVAGLICPFLLKVSFKLNTIRGAYSDSFDASRFFFFQLTRITLGADHRPDPVNGNRWQRALRLVCQRIRSPAPQPDEDSFLALTMLSL